VVAGTEYFSLGNLSLIISGTLYETIQSLTILSSVGSTSPGGSLDGRPEELDETGGSDEIGGSRPEGCRGDFFYFSRTHFNKKSLMR
jgi:hypothetical protein